MHKESEKTVTNPEKTPFICTKAAKPINHPHKPNRTKITQCMGRRPRCPAYIIVGSADTVYLLSSRPLFTQQPHSPTRTKQKSLPCAKGGVKMLF